MQGLWTIGPGNLRWRGIITLIGIVLVVSTIIIIMTPALTASGDGIQIVVLSLMLELSGSSEIVYALANSRNLACWVICCILALSV